MGPFSLETHTGSKCQDGDDEQLTCGASERPEGVSIFFGRRSIESVKSSVVKRRTDVPRQYLEDVEETSSPGAVARKAAFFDKYIRTISLEKSSSPNPSSGQEADRLQQNGAARNLDFESFLSKDQASEVSVVNKSLNPSNGSIGNDLFRYNVGNESSLETESWSSEGEIRCSSKEGKKKRPINDDYREIETEVEYFIGNDMHSTSKEDDIERIEEFVVQDEFQEHAKEKEAKEAPECFPMSSKLETCLEMQEKEFAFTHNPDYDVRSSFIPKNGEYALEQADPVKSGQVRREHLLVQTKASSHHEPIKTTGATQPRNSQELNRENGKTTKKLMQPKAPSTLSKSNVRASSLTMKENNIRNSSSSARLPSVPASRTKARNPHSASSVETTNNKRTLLSGKVNSSQIPSPARTREVPSAAQTLAAPRTTVRQSATKQVGGGTHLGARKNVSPLPTNKLAEPIKPMSNLGNGVAKKATQVPRVPKPVSKPLSDSVRSSVASKPKHVSTNGFNFKSDARAEKRKEFNSKLEEKMAAKEEAQAKLQEPESKELHNMPRSYQGTQPLKCDIRKARGGQNATETANKSDLFQAKGPVLVTRMTRKKMSEEASNRYGSVPMLHDTVHVQEDLEDGEGMPECYETIETHDGKRDMLVIFPVQRRKEQRKLNLYDDTKLYEKKISRGRTSMFDTQKHGLKYEKSISPVVDAIVVS